MLVLSAKERDRLKVVHEVKKGHLTQRPAAAQLKLSDHWVSKLLTQPVLARPVEGNKFEPALNGRIKLGLAAI